MALGDAARSAVRRSVRRSADTIDVTVDGDWDLAATALAALVDHLGGITSTCRPTSRSTAPSWWPRRGHQVLNGDQAAALATYLGQEGARRAGRLARFPDVLTGLMAKLGSDPRPSADHDRGARRRLDAWHRQTASARSSAGCAADADGPDVAYRQLPTRSRPGDRTRAAGGRRRRPPDDGRPVLQASVPPGRRLRRQPGDRLQRHRGARPRRERPAAARRAGLVFVRSAATQPGFGYRDKSSVVLVPDATPESIAAGKRVAGGARAARSRTSRRRPSTPTIADVLTILGARLQAVNGVGRETLVRDLLPALKSCL